MDADLAARLERLERAEQSRSALARYCRSVDERNLDGLRGHFAEAATFRGADGVPREGRRDIVAFFEQLFASMPDGLGARHYVTNIDVDVSGELVVATSIFLMVVPTEMTVLGIGTYRDEFASTGSGVECVSKFITLEKMINVQQTPV